MLRILGASVAVISVVLPLRLPPLPQEQIQNGKVETRRVTAIDREITALAASPEPVWVMWRVPMIDGDRGMCSWYSDRDGTIRGTMLDHSVGGTIVGAGRPQIAPPAGPVQLEAGTQLVVLLRLLDGRVERLRTIGDDCPIDAQGRTVYSLDGVTPTESLRYLGTLVTPEGDGQQLPLPRLQSGLSSSALSAIANHRDAAAVGILERIATADSATGLRQSAMQYLASLRGAAGFAIVKRLLDGERTPEARRQLTSALGQTREPGTVEAMRGLTRDADPKVRAEAVYWFALRGGVAVVPEVIRLVETDPEITVKKRALAGLARLPKDEGVTHLIQIGRASKDPVVRKEAIAILSRSTDPRATAFMEELIKR